MGNENGIPEKVSRPINILVSGEMHERWRVRAFQERRTMAAFVRNAVEVYLRAVEKK